MNENKPVMPKSCNLLTQTAKNGIIYIIKANIDIKNSAPNKIGIKSLNNPALRIKVGAVNENKIMNLKSNNAIVAEIISILQARPLNFA